MDMTTEEMLLRERCLLHALQLNGNDIEAATKLAEAMVAFVLRKQA